MTTEAVAANAAHNLQQAALFLKDLAGREDLPGGFDKLTVKLIVDVTDASQQFITSLAEACKDGG